MAQEQQVFVCAAPKRHVFVCVNDRSCKHRGAGAVLRILLKGASKAGLRDVQITPAQCLNRCNFAPAVIVYPGPVSYHVPTIEDASEILEGHLMGGKVVERLLMKQLP